jgi:hypothetical protein
MSRIFIFPSIILYLLIQFGCRPNTGNTAVIELDSIDLASSGQKINKFDTMGQGLPIFYNMYLSVELSSLFETAGAVFKTDLMNSTDNTSSYITSIQKAVNLGVYAVDLSYAKVFDQTEIAGRYFYAMQQIAKELGIPEDFFELTAKRLEKNITNKDSLLKIANEVYVITDNYLKDNERYTTAAMIIIGGWVEAIYIAVDVAIESEDIDIIEKLVDQKYSLNNLIDMLSDYKDNVAIQEYLVELSKIKKQFDLLDIKFEAGIDPKSSKGKEFIKSAVKKIADFRTCIVDFRTKLVK